MADYSTMPPFLGTEVSPNVLFMLDNSGSMKNSIYDGGSWKCKSYAADFAATETYYGIFEENITYRYDRTIGIDYSGYDGTTLAPYHIDTDNDSDTDSDDLDGPDGAFIEETCTPGLGVNCWSGKFLNWMVTRRIDAARKVMIGGKVENRAGFDYVSGDGNDLEWKILGNNERSDNTICKEGVTAQTYSPFPDGTLFKMVSPADGGATKTTYDPYAKITTQTILKNIAGTVIGEAGIVENFGQDWEADTWETVTLNNVYSKPVIVANPLSYNDSGQSVIRINNVQAGATKTTFDIRIEEWEYRNGKHGKEDISYLVVEKGDHVLAGGEKLVAGTALANGTTSTTVDISSALFPSAPVIITSVTTNNQHDTVINRITNTDTTPVTTSSFDIILQEEKDWASPDPRDKPGDNVAHPDETVAYIGLEQGTYRAGTTFFDVGIASIDSNVTPWSSISFFSSVTGITEPQFLADMQTMNGPDPAELRYQNLLSNSVELFVEEENSTGDGMDHVFEKVGYVAIGQLSFNIALVVEEEPTGVLQDVEDKVRLGVSFYNYKKDTDIYNGETFHGGTLQLSIPKNPFIKNPDPTTGYREITTQIKTDIVNIVDAIEHYPLVWGTTPLAENFYEVVNYYSQDPPFYTSSINTGDANYNATFQVSNSWDPYYFDDPDGDPSTSDAGLIECAQSYVLLFTDGYPYKDEYLPCYNSTTDTFDRTITTPQDGCTDYDGNNSGNEAFNTDADANSNKDNLDDIVHWANSKLDGADRDLRDDLDGEQNIITYTVSFGQSTMPTILQNSADQGGGKGYLAKDGNQLSDQLTNAFTDILSRSSGTSASVISNTRSGEGAIYQSVFFPEKKSAGDIVNWVGEVQALLTDAYGNMREDTNNNDKLDVVDDYIIIYDDSGQVDRYKDADGNQELELTATGCLTDTSISCNTCAADDTIDCHVGDADEPIYLWSSSNWLNDTALVEETQRSTYISDSKERYIFTWIDEPDSGTGLRNNVVDSTELKDFSWPATIPDSAALINPGNIYPYLHLYPSFGDTPAEVTSLSATDRSSLISQQTGRQINWIRGLDVVDASNNPTALSLSGTEIEVTRLRSRQYGSQTLRLGDIAYSTPTLVGRPAEGYHLLYRDSSYAEFTALYLDRRSVVYAGANDGMVHAFNAGFYDSFNKQFCRELTSGYNPYDADLTNDVGCVATGPVLGAELWAYVPYNLLPHLYWSTQPTYNASRHVSYVDLKPRIFDAKIFFKADGVTALDTDHPNGWGTVMVIGMRLGGGSIVADMDKTDGNSPVSTDPAMKSAFMIFDITNPEKKPRLLAEITMPKMGFTTSYPTVVVMKDGDLDGTFGNYDTTTPASGENRWLLAFGSGPADVNGDPGTLEVDSSSTYTGAYDRTILENVTSKQHAQFYMLDLVKLGSKNELHTLTDGTVGSLSQGDMTEDLYPYAVLDTNSFISPPVTVDYDLDYNADALYFGTISDQTTTTTTPDWGGKLRRIVIDDDNDPTKWIADSVLIDVGQPISAAPTIGQDDNDRHMVFFGTGRYFVADDKSNTDLQSYYGVKEPVDDVTVDPLVKNWSTVSTPETARPDGPNAASPFHNGLVNVTDYQVFTDGKVVMYNTSGAEKLLDWADLIAQQDLIDPADLTDEGYSGWYLDFYADDGTTREGERNIGQAALVGGLLSFTTFTPDSDICEAGGTSDLWALYYKTGTAYYSGILGTSDGYGLYTSETNRATRIVSLGKGLAASPNIFVGSGEGSAVVVQSSTGKITTIKEANPLSTKSGIQSWRETQCP